ncbi:hypothetical protein ACJ72_01503 [Emergomyces africanus]|uniref:NACHT-NTPase and P-loop NTPases N-terminal domain-containing protein n=1 Tax=Emergomyces africanus TaxID=1955775 RepID=A0A1B7P5H4_9EURO|nr:hypothetical protein ACJ72_01503 [Emergomyces africanus]
MAEFAVWSPIVSFLTLIQYTNGLLGAQGEMRTAEDIINCTSELLADVKCDFEKFRDHLSRPRKRYTERQIDRTTRELEKARKIVNVNKDQGTGKRQLNGICWVLKNKAALQMCLTALNLYQITLSQIRLELAFLERTMPWIADRLTLEPGTLSYPRSRAALDVNQEHRRLTWVEDGYPNGNQYAISTSQPQRRLLPRPSLPYGCNSFTTSSVYSDPEDLGSWLLQQRRDAFRMRD